MRRPYRRQVRTDILGDMSNEGVIGAVSGLAIKAQGNVTSPGPLLASNGDLSLTAGGQVAAGADIIAQGALRIEAAGFSGSSVEARMSGATVTVNTSGAVSSLGLVSARDGLAITAGSITNGPTGANESAGTLSGQNVTLLSSGALDNAGLIVASQSLSLTAVGDVSNGGTLSAGSDLVLAATNLRTTGSSQIGGRTVVARLSGAFDNLGFVAGRDAVAIDAATLSNGPTATGTRAGEIFGASVALTVDGLVNNAGALEAANGLDDRERELDQRRTACRERRRRPDRIGSRHQQRLDPDRRISTLTAGAYADRAASLLTRKSRRSRRRVLRERRNGFGFRHARADGRHGRQPR